MKKREISELKKIYRQLDDACKEANLQKCNEVRKCLENFVKCIDSNCHVKNRYNDNRVMTMIPPVLVADDVCRKINDKLTIFAIKREQPLNLYDKKLIKKAASSLSLKFNK